MTQQIELFYDFRSPYSYLAFTQLRQMDVVITLRPMKILKVMEKVGNVPTTITCAAKGRYARVDVGRWAQRYGVPLNPSDMRADDGDACSRAVLTLANAADVVAAIADAGIDTEPIAARIDRSEKAAQLDANTDEAAERGVFGSPTVFVGEAMFFGNDRLEFVREELARLEEAA